MTRLNKFRHHWQAAAVLASVCFASPAYATDPLPGDEVAPPANVNIAMFYDQYSYAGTVGEAHGGTISNETRISDNIATARYIRTFMLGNVEAGVQAYIPYISFFGQQRLDIAPSALTFGQAASARLRSQNGFGQPNFGFFFWALKDAAAGNYIVVAPWIAPPIGSFNKNDSLNAEPNVWQYEMELGGRYTFYGKPSDVNAALVLYTTGYAYGSDKSANYITPAVTIPAFAFESSQTSTPGSFHEQPSLEVRAYLPIQVYPPSHAVIAPGFFQSFGGKQTYNVQGGPRVDTGTRTNESQLRLVLSSFITPHAQIMAVGEYDIAARGGPLYRGVDLRLTFLF